MSIYGAGAYGAGKFGAGVTQLTADFEAGTDGNTITTGDTGSQTAWDTVVTNGSTTIKYSTTHAAHGSQSAKFSAVTQSAMYLQWDSAMGATTDNYGRVYLWRDSLDATNIHYWLSVYDNAANFICRFMISQSGKVAIQNSAGSTIATGTTTVATGQWTRLEYKIVNNASTGILEVKLFNTADSTTADDTVTATGQNTRADTGIVRFGSEQVNSAGYAYYLDDIVAGATSYPGPVSGGGGGPSSGTSSSQSNLIASQARRPHRGTGRSHRR